MWLRSNILIWGLENRNYFYSEIKSKLILKIFIINLRNFNFFFLPLRGPVTSYGCETWFPIRLEEY